MEVLICSFRCVLEYDEDPLLFLFFEPYLCLRRLSLSAMAGLLYRNLAPCTVIESCACKIMKGGDTRPTSLHCLTPLERYAAQPSELDSSLPEDDFSSICHSVAEHQWGGRIAYRMGATWLKRWSDRQGRSLISHR